MERLSDIFVTRVLRSEGALVTDESLLRDFSGFFDYDVEDALRPGRKPGRFVFKKHKFLRGAQLLPASERRHLREQIPDEEIEAKPSYFRRDTLRRALTLFAVDIDPVFDRRLPEILQYVAANMPETKRAHIRRLLEAAK